MRILIVDDDRMSGRAIEKLVSQMGHTPMWVENGAKAITQLIDFNPDLMVCDIMMPGLSGLETVSIFRNIYLYRKPIIMISSADHRLTATRSLDAGADLFLHKPFSPGELKERISRFVA